MGKVIRKSAATARQRVPKFMISSSRHTPSSSSHYFHWYTTYIERHMLPQINEYTLTVLALLLQTSKVEHLFLHDSFKCKYFGGMRTETYLYGYIAIGYGLVRYLKYFQYESWIKIAYPSPYSQIFMNRKTANMMGHL